MDFQLARIGMRVECLSVAPTVSAEGTLLTMDLAPERGEYVLSDLTSGPVLFATC